VIATSQKFKHQDGEELSLQFRHRGLLISNIKNN
jgi:hypothetical protein